MSISKELFLAILSMDAYNRNYGAGISLPGDRVGNATISKDSEKVFADPDAPEGTPTAAQAAGFYAIAYTIGAGVEGIAPGTIVISYRGTDDLRDAWNDFQLATGGALNSVPEQTLLAGEFYRAVRAQNPDANIVLTGHSLGGALAGGRP